MKPAFEEAMKRQRYIAGASLVGLDPNWLDKTYIESGKTFKIIGLSSTGKRVCLEHNGSSTWSAPVSYVKVKMAKNPKAAQKAIDDEREKEYRKSYKLLAATYGLPADGIGKQFRDGKHVCTILGLKNGRREMKVAIEKNGNRGWWYAVSGVKELLKSNPVA